MALTVTVVDLTDIRASDARQVGPKMARLGQLAADGWRVPDGYAVTAGALAQWLPAPARASLEQLFATAPGASGHAELGRLAEQARSLIVAQPLPSSLVDEVCAAHAALERRSGRGAALRVAVRSSAVGEDGHAASFAGQYESYLGIRGAVDVLAHIRKCWASRFSAHALEYLRRFGGTSPLRAHDLAVGVLELVDARSAGVAFTMDPVTGDRGVCVIEGNWGFGESVVSGHVSPDHWRVDRATGQVLTARLGAKGTWAVSGSQAGPVALTALPDSLAGRLCLDEHEVRHIAAQAAAIEEAAGGVPQDVEWAVARDQRFPDSVFILQHRPETTWTGTGGGDDAAAGSEPGTTTAAAQPASDGAGPAAAPAAREGFDPVRYALRNVFKVPGS